MTAEEQLLREWRGIAYRIAGEFYLPGADRDDVRQEAMIGLLKGIRSYRPHLGANQRSFYAVCVRRHLIAALRIATRMRHEQLTRAARTVVSDEGDTVDILELCPGGRDPFELVSGRERFERIRDRIGTLTPLEARSLLGVTAGFSYAEIGGNAKTIDNAIARARRKLAVAA